MAKAAGKDDFVKSVIDRVYSTMRTSQIEKTPEERNAICELASSLGIASGFIQDAHNYMSDYGNACQQILDLDPMIKSLIPPRLLTEMNRLVAISEAWKEHAENEIFKGRTVDFEGMPEELEVQEMDDILSLAASRDEVLEKQPESTEEAVKSSGNVVSLFKN